MSNDPVLTGKEKAPVLPAKGFGQHPEPTKIRIIEDRDATGETAAAYNYWRAGSGRRARTISKTIAAI